MQDDSSIYKVVVMFTAIYVLYYVFEKCIIFVVLLLYLELILVGTLDLFYLWDVCGWCVL